MHTKNQDQSKMLGLEIIRFFSAIAVLVFHYGHFAYVGLHRADNQLNALPYHQALYFLYKYGDYGVQAFWTLSGFIFYWKYLSPITSRRMNGWNFFVLRLSRLYPLHFLTLLSVALLQSIYIRTNGSPFVYDGNDWVHFVLHLFMASNWRGQWGLSFNGPVWSVSTEVLIYAAFFLMLRMSVRSFWSCVLIAVICAGARHLNVDNRIVMCASFFFSGGASAVLLQSATKNHLENHLKRAILALTIALPVGYLGGFFASGHGNLELAFLNLWVPCLVMLLATTRIPSNEAFRSSLEAAGNVTYASYLLHFPVQLAVASYFTSRGENIPYRSELLFLAFMVGTLTLSVLVYRRFELPAQQHIRRLLLKP